MLHQELPASTARRQRTPVAGGHADGNQATVTTADQGRYEPTLSTQGQAKRSILHVARAHDMPVLAKPGRSDS
jgi:hypothetical protein